MNIHHALNGIAERVVLSRWADFCLIVNIYQE